MIIPSLGWGPDQSAPSADSRAVTAANQAAGTRLANQERMSSVMDYIITPGPLPAQGGDDTGGPFRRPLAPGA